MKLSPDSVLGPLAVLGQGLTLSLILTYQAAILTHAEVRPILVQAYGRKKNITRSGVSPTKAASPATNPDISVIVTNNLQSHFWSAATCYATLQSVIVASHTA